MDLQLMRLRKQAGYRSRDDFAKEIEVNKYTYKSWETGAAMMSLEQACQICNVLNCTLDQLAGRTPPGAAAADERLERIERAYRDMNETGRDALETSARALHALPENAGESGAVEGATA